MKKEYLTKSLFVLIPLVGVITAGVYLISFGVTDAALSIKMMINGTVMTAGIWAGCVAIVFFLWRKFPWEETPLLHLVLEIVLITSYTLVFSYMLYRLEMKFWKIPEFVNLPMEAFTTILITFFITALHESVFFYRQWKDNFSKSVRLEKANIEARYEALMAQINPHFLFNSLNSLTTMVEDKQEVVDYIQNLSGLLRYMMKSGEKELTLVKEEFEITGSYLSLQKARFGTSLEFISTVPEELYNKAVPTLVLITLVENCIKHNIISREKPLSIKMTAGIDSITISNNLQRKNGVESTGQGLVNIRGRYSFFTHREVVVNETTDRFSVTIPLLETES